MVVQDQSRHLTDLGRVTGRRNLEQAIILRLLTPRGELAALRKGGVAAFGYPLSEPFRERDESTGAYLMVQYFERAVFE